MKALSVEGTSEARLSHSPGSKALGAAGVSEAALEELPIKELTGMVCSAALTAPAPDGKGQSAPGSGPADRGPDAAYANTSRPLPLVLLPGDFAGAGTRTRLTGI